MLTPSRRKRAGAKAGASLAPNSPDVCVPVHVVFLMFFVDWWSPARCETKPCHLLSIYDLFSILHYIKCQAVLLRNALAKLAPAETVRAFYATVLVSHHDTPADTVGSNRAMLRRNVAGNSPSKARHAFQAIFIRFFKFR